MNRTWGLLLVLVTGCGADAPTSRSLGNGGVASDLPIAATSSGGAPEAIVSTGGAAQLHGAGGGSTMPHSTGGSATGGAAPGSGGSAYAATGGANVASTGGSQASGGASVAEPDGGSTPEDAGETGGATGTAGAKGTGGVACECTSGPCCDGCRFFGSGHQCAHVVTRGTCDPIATTSACAGRSELDLLSTSYLDTWCTGASSACDGRQAPGVVTHSCGGDGMRCVQAGTVASPTASCARCP